MIVVYTKGIFGVKWLVTAAFPNPFLNFGIFGTRKFIIVHLKSRHVEETSTVRVANSSHKFICDPCLDTNGNSYKSKLEATTPTMPTKIGINGFGRIGRLVMRAALDHPDGEFVALLDIWNL